MLWVSNPYHLFEGLRLTIFRVTLTGDAAHVITPFTGTGVNIAMHDAYDLSVALEKVAFEGAAIDEVLSDYEKKSYERAAYWARKCVENQETWLSGKSVPDIVKDMAAMLGWSE